MPTIEMSAGFANGISQRIARLNETASVGSALLSTAGLLGTHNIGSISSPSAWLFLMKGTPPVSFPSNLAARSGDFLCQFASNLNGATAPVSGDFQTSLTGINPLVISTQYATATLSGTCTWFWHVTTIATSLSANAPASTSAALTQQIIGTVGLTGSGADLEIPNVNIVAGEQYRIVNLRLLFPTSWTY